MTLAQRVREFRYSKGWGPDELANRAAISRTALYQIESGKTELPRAGTLRRIAMALEVSMESLLGHGDMGARPGRVSAAHPPATGRKTKGGAEWVPSEGGPLNLPSTRPGTAVENGDPTRFGVEVPSTVSAVPSHDEPAADRERELAWMFHELLASPLGESVARIVEETYRLLPSGRMSG